MSIYDGEMKATISTDVRPCNTSRRSLAVVSARSLPAASHCADYVTRHHFLSPQSIYSEKIATVCRGRVLLTGTSSALNIA